LHPQVLVTNLPKLPIRRIDFSNSAEKAQHDKMVSLVTQILDLNKALLDAKTQAHQELYRQQIATTDRRIDELVSGLYGLTPDEIAVVKSQK
jgi:hypothetical protein